MKFCSSLRQSLFARALSACCALTVLLATAYGANTKVVASTIPANGDINPYGLVVVPATTGSLVQGNLLISNFNDAQNLQGTGSTIVQITPGGNLSLFAQINAANLPGPCPGGIGLTTALVALRSGFVVVGSLPTTDGTSATAQAGCLLVLNSSGTVVETFSGSLINGPWDMSALDNGGNVSLFVTNVLNGTVAAGGNVVSQGTVVRLDLVIGNGQIPFLQSMTVIGSGFSERTDPAALVIGPTGVHLGGSISNPVLYVADSLNNRIVAIPDAITRTGTAGIGVTVSTGGSLDDPLGLTVGSNGNIVAMNGNNGLGILISPSGQQLGKVLLDDNGTPPGAGALFGVTFLGTQLYYVDDDTNTLNVLQ